MLSLTALLVNCVCVVCIVVYLAGNYSHQSPAISAKRRWPNCELSVYFVAAVGRGGGGADSTSHILGKHELKGPSRQYVFVCLCECVNTIEIKLQPSVGQ